MAEGAFKFNFGAAAPPPQEQDDHQLVHAAAELLPFDGAAQGAGVPTSTVSIRTSGGAVHLLKADIASDQCATLLGCAAASASDLVPGQYEGGFKLWEGAVDLAAALLDTYPVLPAREPRQGEVGEAVAGTQAEGEGLEGARVLELGCGHGLPGIAALLAGAHVTFHDFNREVLEAATMPNVAFNADAAAQRRAAFLCGDFASACTLLAQASAFRPFDLVLTAESIYNAHSAQQILEGCDACLSAAGRVVLAAKSHYFGVGGGLAAFKAQVARHGAFEARVMRRIDDGASNVREVLQLTRRR